jgi:hypothetical protein
MGMVAVLAAAGLGILACGDDDDAPGGVTPGGPDGGGAETSTGSSSGNSSSSGGPKPEPTCTPVTGAPSWTMKDQPIPGWAGSRDKVLEPQITGIAGLAYGNGTWVALARSQQTTDVTWATSTDAETWTVHTTPAAGGTKFFALPFVIFDGTKFLFMGTNEQGTFAYTSTDGASFSTSQKVGDTAMSLGVIAANGGGGYVVTGSNGRLLSTTDGTTWTQRTPTGANPAGYLDVAFGGGKYVVTDEPFNTPALVSGDGIAFNAIPSPILGSNVSFGNGVFHGRGNGKVYKSTDGSAWTEETLSGTGIGATDQGKIWYLAGRWLIQRVEGQKGTSEFGTSADGAAWTEYGKDTVGLPTPALHGVLPRDIVYGGCHYISFGNYERADDSQGGYMIIATVSPAQ